MIEKIAKEYIALIPNVFNSFRDLNKNLTELSHIQNHVIEFIYIQQRVLNIKDISIGLNIAKQQLTNVIKDLEIRGYIEKIPDTKDKRASLILLTPAGKEVINQKWTKIYQNFSGNLMKLNNEEQTDLNFALHKVNVLLKKMEE